MSDRVYYLCKFESSPTDHEDTVIQSRHLKPIVYPAASDSLSFADPPSYFWLDPDKRTNMCFSRLLSAEHDLALLERLLGAGVKWSDCGISQRERGHQGSSLDDIQKSNNMPDKALQSTRLCHSLLRSWYWYTSWVLVVVPMVVALVPLLVCIRIAGECCCEQLTLPLPGLRLKRIQSHQQVLDEF